MKKILLLIGFYLPLIVSAQTYTLNYDSVRVGKNTTASKVAIPGDLLIKSLSPGNIRIGSNGKVVKNDTLYINQATGDERYLRLGGVAVDNGIWNQWIWPLVAYDGSNYYFSSAGNIAPGYNTSVLSLAKMDASGAITKQIVGQSRTTDGSFDDHDAPAILLDKRSGSTYPIMLFQSEHNTQKLRFAKFTSKDPKTWANPTWIEIGTGTTAYSEVFRHGDEILVGTRGTERPPGTSSGTKTIRWYYSSDNGTNWVQNDLFWKNSETMPYTLMREKADSSGINILFNTHPISSTDKGIYFLELNWSSGALINPSDRAHPVIANFRTAMTDTVHYNVFSGGVALNLYTASGTQRKRLWDLSNTVSGEAKLVYSVTPNDSTTMATFNVSRNRALGFNLSNGVKTFDIELTPTGMPNERPVGNNLYFSGASIANDTTIVSMVYKNQSQIDGGTNTTDNNGLTYTYSVNIKDTTNVVSTLIFQSGNKQMRPVTIDNKKVFYSNAFKYIDFNNFVSSIGINSLPTGKTTIPNYVTHFQANLLYAKKDSVVNPAANNIFTGTNRFNFDTQISALFFLSSRAAANTASLVPSIYAADGTGTAPFNTSGNLILQSRPSSGRGIYFMAGATPTLAFSITGASVAIPLITTAGYAKFSSAGVFSSSASVPTTDLSGTLQAAQEPAHTGDVTNTAGSLALTIKSSVALAGSPTTTTQAAATNNTSIATTAYVKSQGYGAGTVTSVGSGYGTNFTAITGSGSVVVDSTLFFKKATGQTNNINSINNFTNFNYFNGNTILNSGGINTTKILNLTAQQPVYVTSTGVVNAWAGQIFGAGNSTTFTGPLNALSFAGNINITPKTANYTYTSTDYTIQFNCTGGALLANLPAAATVPTGIVYNVKKIDSSINTLTITPNGAELIDGAAALVISMKSNVQIQNTSTGWIVL